MLHLENRELRLDVFEPTADAARLGPRYCWGGYIWQVHDIAAGPLLTGPEWPEPAPSPFNGQGLPESFRHRTLEGRPLTWRGDHGVALGAGDLQIDASGNVVMTKPSIWEILTHRDRLIFTTRHESAGVRCELVRTLELTGREVRSMTQLTNTSGAERLTLEWFTHPFFPLVDGMVRAEVPAGTVLADNVGFVIKDRTLAQKRRFVRQDDGHMERGLRLPPDRSLVATLAHPVLAHIHFETSFAPDSCVIWGNYCTFSFEPYLTLDLAPGESRRWSLLYRFGASSAASASKTSSRTSDPR